MKQLLAVLYILSFVLTFLLAALFGLLYLEKENPDAYNRITKTLNQMIQAGENSFKGNSEDLSKKFRNYLNIQNDKISSIEDLEQSYESQKEEPATIPIIENARDIISPQELQLAKRTDRIPVKGNGKEVDEASSSLDTGDLGEDYLFSQLMYPYRAMLDTEGQKAYNQIYAHAMSYNSSPFAVQASINVSQMDDIMTAVYNDHPDLFWLETQYSYQYGANRKVQSITLEFNETISNITNNKAKFNERVSTIIALANEYESDVEKERFVHDYLVDTVTYNESAPMHQTAYSALVNGSSVCAGYSRAFQHIMMQMGIPVYYAAGIANGGPHAWNIIKLGTDFYNVDTLWNDSIGEQYNTRAYLYFNIQDSEFNKEHRRTGLSVNLPPCNGTDMFYEAVFGESAMGDMLDAYGLSEEDILYNLREYYKYCERALTKAGVGQSSFRVVLADKGLFDEIYYDVSRKGYVEGYMKPVAENLGLRNCSMSLSLSANELPDGRVILTQDTNLTAQY